MLQDSAISDPHTDRKIFVLRLIVAAVMVLVLSSIMIYRYFDLQIVRHQDYITNSNNNRIHIRPVLPPRGLIFDSNGHLLADNRPTYTLNIIADRTQTVDDLLDKLGSLISLSEQDLSTFEKRFKRGKSFEPIALKYNLTEKERAILAVNGHLLVGAEVSAQLTRYYPSGELFAHVVGYMGRINEQERQSIDLNQYRGIDFIGKIGLEKYYENQMLGGQGTEQVETNALGRVMRVLGRTDPVSGEDLTLYIDSRLQKVAHNALKDRRGALVAMDVKTGGILSMVSMPAYDPNPFVSGISQRDYDKLINS